MPIVFGLTQNNTIIFEPGVIHSWGGIIAPIGWLLCDGASVSRTTYATLFSNIGTAFGTAGGNFFNLPDLRGRFLRGVSGASTNDPNRTTRTAMNTGGNAGNAVGSVQGNATAKNGLILSDPGHFHFISLQSNSQNGVGRVTVGSYNPEGAVPNTDSSTANLTLTTGDSETRPLNAYVQFIIKY